MDINLDCGYCGKSWSYQNVDMPQAELITHNWEQHSHSMEELKAFHESFDTEPTDWVDPEE